MPLVKPSNMGIIKISLPVRILEELERYSDWSEASKTKVIRTALERLFKQDKEWDEMMQKGEAGMTEQEGSLEIE